jgi:hypothetical protein
MHYTRLVRTGCVVGAVLNFEVAGVQDPGTRIGGMMWISGLLETDAGPAVLGRIDGRPQYARERLANQEPEVGHASTPDGNFHLDGRPEDGGKMVPCFSLCKVDGC